MSHDKDIIGSLAFGNLFNPTDAFNQFLTGEMAGKGEELDLVNNPPHYTWSSYEVIDVIEKLHLGFPLGNAVKYIARAGKKDPAKIIQDFEKSVFYMKYYLKHPSGKLQIDDEYIDIVLEDWNLSDNCSIAVKNIASGTLKNIELAITSIQDEIKESQ